MAQLKNTTIEGFLEIKGKDENGKALILPEGSTIYVGNKEFEGGSGGGSADVSFENPEFTGSLSMGRTGEKVEGSVALGTNVMALGEGSVAFGKDSAAGCKGYYISAIDFNNNKIYLSKTEVKSISTTSFPAIDTAFDSPAYEVGEKFNVVGGGIAHWAPAGTINSILYNTITFNNDDTLNHNFNVNNIEKNKSYIFFTPLHPDIGSIEASSCGFVAGLENYAIGAYSVAEGCQNISLGNYSHTEGRLNIAGFAAHAEGLQSEALGIRSHAEGTSQALEGWSHSEGKYTKASNIAAHAEGSSIYTKDSVTQKDIITTQLEASGLASHAEGQGTIATQTAAHAEGKETVAKGIAAHAEGYSTEANKDYSHAEGQDTVADNTAAHAEGYLSKAKSMYSHAEGEECEAKGVSSHAEGRKTETTQPYAHAEGNATHAQAEAAHAEGGWTYAKGKYSHAEGSNTHAIGDESHSEGWYSHAEGQASHAEGKDAYAIGKYSHAEGAYTNASSNCQHVQGKYNEIDSASKYAHIVGWGTAENARKNIHTVDTYGNPWFAGNTISFGGKADEPRVKLEYTNGRLIISVK